MDANVVAALAPSDPSDGAPSSIPALPIVRDEKGAIAVLRDEVRLALATGETRLVLRPLRELFVGDARAPDLSHGPTAKLEPLFMLIESTVVRFCKASQRDATDQEMERVFSELRRRPDNTGGPLRSYLRAAAQLYLSVHDVSSAEYAAVMARLTKSARTFSRPPISRNYLATLLQIFGE